MAVKSIIAVVNQKGGVGKTTTAINVAAQLAKNFNVLLIDLDPQGNATGGLGFAKSALKATVYELMLGDAKLSSLYLDTSVKNLSLIGSNSDLAGAEVEMVPKERREFILKDRLIGSNYDYLIIDCPPSLGLLTINALTAATSVLIPVQTEYYALEGLSQLLNTIQSVKQATNPDLNILGVVLTMYDKRNALSGQVKDEVVNYFNDTVFSTTIPRNVRLAEAPSYGSTIYQYDKRSKGSKAYMSLTKEVVERTKG